MLAQHSGCSLACPAGVTSEKLIRKILVAARSSSALTDRHTSGADRDRTDDLRLAKPALSQLSYSPVWWA